MDWKEARNALSFAMALFFDHAWFDAQLQRLHMRREDVAAMLGLDAEQIADVWKDQRELKAADVAILAALFNVQAAEISDRAGISTPIPRLPARSDEVMARLDAIEAKLDRVLTLLSGQH
jgi:transcriptional regulator with XRE-family HTH domain